MGTSRVVGQLLVAGLSLWLLLPLRDILLCLVGCVALVPALPLAMTRHISHFQVFFYWLSYEWEYDLKCHLDYFRVTI